MTDLGRRGILTKAALFAVIVAMGATGVLLHEDPWYEVALLAVTVWAACRAYYFLFHVLEHWVGVEGRYTGLIDLARRLHRLHRQRRVR